MSSDRAFLGVIFKRYLGYRSSLHERFRVKVETRLAGLDSVGSHQLAGSVHLIRTLFCMEH